MSFAQAGLPTKSCFVRMYMYTYLRICRRLPGYPIPKKLKKRMLVFDSPYYNPTVPEQHVLGKDIPEVEDAVSVVPKNVTVRTLVYGQEPAVDDNVASEPELSPEAEEDAQMDSDSNAEVAQVKPPSKKRKQKVAKKEKVPPSDAPAKKKKKKQDPLAISNNT